MSEHPYPYPTEPDRIDRLEARMGGIEGRLHGIGKQISILTWAVGLGFGLGFPATFAIIGWMWTSLSADIGGVRNELGSVRTDVVELQRALPALELRLGNQINTLERTLADRINTVERTLAERITAVERTLAERIHSLELAFTRAGIELGPPREQNAPGPDGGETPGQQGMLEPLAPGDAQIRSAP